MPDVISFLDTEFTDLLNPELLSLGLVTLDGREFYAELDLSTELGRARRRASSNFVRHGGVLEMWGLVTGAACTQWEMGRRAAEWLLGLAAESGHKVNVAFDYATDYELLEYAVRDAGLWDQVREVVRPIDVDAITGTITGELAAEETFRELDVVRGLRRHHALADAHALRAAYRAAVRPLRVIFLDFDGVLHPENATPWTGNRFQHAPQLARMLAPWPDVRIVVHSSWRLDHTVEQLRTLVGPLGSRVIGVTPRLQREDSILAAVEQLGRGGRPVDWRVLDDAPDEFTKLDETRLIVCDPDAGVSGPGVLDHVRAWLDGGAR